MIPALLPAADAAAGLAGGGPDLTQYLLVCGFLILLVAGLGWAFRRLAQGALRGRAEKRALATVDVLPLGGKQRVAVVRCYDRSYLIGLGDKEVRLLAALDEEAAATAEAPALRAPASRPAGAPAARVPRAGFLETLRRHLQAPEAAPSASAAARASAMARATASGTTPATPPAPAPVPRTPGAAGPASRPPILAPRRRARVHELPGGGVLG